MSSMSSMNSMNSLESILSTFRCYNTSPSEEFELYQENLRLVKDASDKLLSFMKGHSASFRSDITDRKWKFSHKWLKALVDEMLTRWAAKQREGTFLDPSTGKSLAEPYIQARMELYRSYLYLVMRCSMCYGAYALVTGSETMEEKTDFAFLLDNARTMWQSWCVMEMPDGSKENEPFFGYDWHFGFHLYRVLSRPASGYNNLLDWDYLCLGLPVDRPASLTDEGNVKRIAFKRIYLGETPPSLTKEAAQPGEVDATGDGTDGYGGEEGYDDCCEDDGYAFEEDDIDAADAYDRHLWYDIEAKYEDETKDVQRQCDLEHLASCFEHPGEYIKACESFVKQFRDAKPEVLRGFYDDLEEIIALHLVGRYIPPLMNANKVQIVHDGICDGPYKQAERYARSVQLTYS